MGDGRVAPVQGATPSPPRLTAGGLVSGGRYELLEPHGGVAGQAFWRARDKRLGRDVALTFVDPLPGEAPPGSATGVLDRTVALTGVYSDGLARVLDVIRGRAGGIVVSEWVPGRSLTAAVAEPEPGSAVGAVRGLADAATRAEEKGLALGLDSPDRIRLTEDGRALLAFPGVRSSADTRGDVRGLGAVLYALLTGSWPGPLPDGSDAHEPRDGRPGAAPVDDDDELVDPTVLGSGVPPESAVLAMRSLDGSSVSSAATVRSMIADRVGGPAHAAAPGAPPVAGYSAVQPAAQGYTAQNHSAHEHTAQERAAQEHTAQGFATPGGAAATPGYSGPLSTAAASTAPAAAGDSPGNTSTPPGDPDPQLHSHNPPDAQTQKRRWHIMAGTSAGAVVVIALLAAWMLGALTGGGDETPLSQQLDAIERAAQASRSAEAVDPDPEETGEGEPVPAAASPTTPVEVADASSWQPSSSPGTAENSGSAPNVIDGDTATVWSTDTYLNQLGDSGAAFKPGVGLLLSLDEANEVQKVVVRSDDDGVEFEIRAADSATPTSLDDTTLLGKGTVRDGSGTVTIDDAVESEYVLVWITRLGTSGPQAYDASISEVELTR
ncbi:protein kinase family protein [Rhodococcus sp. IEGM 1408]|uniref:protein kinase family protein n=1 Tax=Rhodococcus sp. IEGM 1408 TaxID=3082220 RepID=UPI0029553397|nr:protein kinase family protein [Rhodococcus sp. IEGM 1408]MDV8000089.1 protein kinase family protein [Rhodococcus sp. IEGM 1408]